MPIRSSTTEHIGGTEEQFGFLFLFRSHDNGFVPMSSLSSVVKRLAGETRA